jgi:6-phosphogluconolactonase/glucosamine-6-phosphate isomerase/deaminase
VISKEECSDPSKKSQKRCLSFPLENLERASHLFYASSGLRKSEALNLNMNQDVDSEMRCALSSFAYEHTTIFIISLGCLSIFRGF